MFVVDSDFDTGQNPPLAFFLTPVVVVVGGCCSEGTSFCVMVTVVLVELFEASDEDELLRCTVFRCGRNIRDTSSLLILLKPPPVPPRPFQFNLDMFCRLGGEATAVVIGRFQGGESLKIVVKGVLIARKPLLVMD
jgi:hypothetical protein